MFPNQRRAVQEKTFCIHRAVPTLKQAPQNNQKDRNKLPSFEL